MSEERWHPEKKGRRRRGPFPVTSLTPCGVQPCDYACTKSEDSGFESFLSFCLDMGPVDKTQASKDLLAL